MLTMIGSANAEATRRYNFNNIKQSELNGLIESSEAGKTKRQGPKIVESIDQWKWS